MRLGILGGSFNPVHYGHLFLADAALSILKLDRIIMIPAFRSPFKLDAESLLANGGDVANHRFDADSRLEMLVGAVSCDPRIAVDECEIRRGGVSYTVDTLEDIISRYMPKEKPVLIIGDDLARDFPKWRDSERILQIADVVIARRCNAAEVNFDSTSALPYPHTFINNERMNISSQMVRQKIKDALDWRSLVPSAARAIIEDRRLYGYSPYAGGVEPAVSGCSSAMIFRVETEARETLNTERFLHSRNTALLAFDLCRRFGLDPQAGYLAGIAHDLAKQLDVKLMLKLAKSDGNPVSELEKEKPHLLHGRAAAVMLKERFGIQNKDVLEAVAFHVSGSENMGDLAKVIYIADKTEISRNIEPALRKMCMEDELPPDTAEPKAAGHKYTLDNILFAVLKKTVIKLQAKKLDLSEDTLRLLERVKERN